MNDHGIAAGTLSAVPALDQEHVHLWYLPYGRDRGRAPLLALLAAYLGIPGEELGLTSGTHGRPAVARPHRLDFNWSHSGTHALVAVARNLPTLGVDVELQRPRERAMDLAQRYFDAAETKWLQGLPAPARAGAFVDLWTAKEAVLKGFGRGLAYGLHRIALHHVDGGLRPWRFDGPAGPASAWQLHQLTLAAGLRGAVAWRGPPRTLALFGHDELFGKAPV